MRRFVWLAVFVTLAALGEAQDGLRILSQYKSSFVLNGVFQQNNTVTVQCTQSDFGIWRYLTLTKADGTTQALGVRCNAPEYQYTKTLVGYIPNDGIALLYSNCLLQSPYGFDPSLLAVVDFSRAPTNPGQLVAQSIHRHKAVMRHRPENRATKHRKIFGALLGGVVGGALYCAIAGCGGGGGLDQGKLDALNTRVDTLQQTTANLQVATTAMAGQITTLFTAQSQFATQISSSLQTTTQLFEQQLTLANQSLQAQRDTTDYLTYLNGGLTNDLTNLKAQLGGTQDQVASLEQSVLAGFNVSAGNLAAVVRDLNYVSGNLSQQINTSSTACMNRLGYLRARVEKLSGKLQAQLTNVNDLIRNTQARRALAEFTQQELTGIINQGYTPFLVDLGTAPSADSSEFVWKMNIEVSRVMYIRNSGGLTAQQLDVAWYCSTQQLIRFGDSVSTWMDIFSHFGPTGCNNTLAGNCTCWAVSQRYSCATTSGAYNASDWLLQSDLRASNVCTSAVTTSDAVSHVTLDSLLVVLSAVCNDGTWNNENLRVISGMMGRSASVPYNGAVCGMVFDTLADVSATGINFMYGILFYLQLSFGKVYVTSDSFAKYIYGTVPEGVTTVEDPLATVNGTDMRCFYSSFMSFDNGVEPMLPVYKLTFASTTASVSMSLDNVTANDVTEVTAAVPEDIVLPPSDEYVVGDPADPSVCYNAPYSALSLSPSSQGRCGGLDYALVDHPDNFTISKWNVANRAIFDHFCATNVASYYRRTLNGQGLCTGTALVGEGSQCTIRQNFEVSSVVGGVKYTPRAGTTATSIVRMIIPDGNLTSLIFSECPSVSLQQTAPNVATLTLGNPRPDSDITVAIVLGGACSATVSSFTIEKNTQRPYLIPVCSGATSSARTVTVYRYDSQQQLQLCGNTTSFTVDRQTFISNFATPDLLQVNVTTQIQLDSNQLALQRGMNDLRDIMAQIAIASVKSQLSTGIQLDVATYNLWQSVMGRIQDNAVLTANLIDTTRDTSLANYSAAFSTYSTAQDANIAAMNATINASRALLDVLSQQAYNASSLAAHLAELTNTTNIAINYWNTLFNENLNATLAVTQGVVGVLNSIHFDSPVGLAGLSDFFGGIGSFLENKIIDPGIAKLVSGLEYIARAAVGAANFVKDFVSDGLKALTGIAGNIFAIIFWILVAIGGFAGLYLLYMARATIGNKSQIGRAMRNELSISDLKPARTDEGAPQYAPRPPQSTGQPRPDPTPKEPIRSYSYEGSAQPPLQTSLMSRPTVAPVPSKPTVPPPPLPARPAFSANAALPQTRMPIASAPVPTSGNLNASRLQTRRNLAYTAVRTDAYDLEGHDD